MKNRIGKALVVGGGISGVRSSLDLAEMGYSVTLIDRSPFLGGILSQLDYQFPTDHCGMCKMLPSTNRDIASQVCMRKGFYHENIDIKLSTELVSVEGEPGRYTATLKQEPFGIDPDRCNGCGECLEACPIEVPDTFNLGLGTRKAIFLPVPHNYPHLYQIDFNACDRCGDCIDICPTKAISLPEEGAEPIEEQIEVGAVILSGGTDYFQPDPQKDTYGYHTFPDVVTSREFERLISGTGPTGGKLSKPSDGKPVQSIAWFQCVGSRDMQSDAGYCSTVCCMHAIKEARLARDMFGDGIETTIFYMDLRTNGKSFQRYRDEAEESYGVRFERSRIHTVTWSDEKQQLEVRYLTEDGELVDRHFDMIVLSVGQRPAAQTDQLAETLGLDLNEWGFCEPQPFSSVITSKEGMILSGSYTGLKDISESLIQAGSAANAASRVLHRAGASLSATEAKAAGNDEPDMELPRVLTAICHPHGSMVDGLNMDAVDQALRQDPSVSGFISTEALTDDEVFQQLKEAAKNQPSNRLLLATGTPHVFRRKLKEISSLVNIAPGLIEIADLNGTSRKDLSDEERQHGLNRILKTGISKLKYGNPMNEHDLPVNQRALVVGGGVAGLSAALSIAENGYEVDLVEKGDHLGGMALSIEKTLEGQPVKPIVDGLIDKVKDNPLITVHLNTEVSDCYGEVGRFSTVLASSEHDEPAVLTHGAVIMATGGREAATESYHYGESDKIVTLKQFGDGLNAGDVKADQLNSVAMIQCVDSREEPRNYCSRVCCPTALKHALEIKQANPDCNVMIFYRDMMTPGFSEAYYTEARKAGIHFIPYQADKKPEVAVNGDAISLTAYEPILGRDIQIEPDLLVLSTGLQPEVPAHLANSLAVELDQDGFFKEAEPKWRPLDALKEGVFYSGICLSPRNITESITSGEAAAQRSLRILCDEWLAAGKHVAQVRDVLCSKCERCIEVCPYKARSYNPETDTVTVNPAMCQGCGSCAVVCPNSASILEGFADQQLFDMIDVAVAG